MAWARYGGILERGLQSCQLMAGFTRDETAVEWAQRPGGEPLMSLVRRLAIAAGILALVTAVAALAFAY